MSHKHDKQLRTVIIIEFCIAAFVVSVAVFFWRGICHHSLLSCLKDAQLSPSSFLGIAFLRPFVLTPLTLYTLMAGRTFGVFWGAFYSAIGAVLSCAVVFFLAKALGRRFVTPWFRHNLPETYKFIRSQDWKIVLASRLIPFVPFDASNFIFGLLDFRWRWVLLITFLGVIPEVFVFSEIAKVDATLSGSLIWFGTVFFFFFLLPVFLYERRVRKVAGKSSWVRLKAVWFEIQMELKLNNMLVKRQSRDPKKLPILLLYGFFSSRRTVTVLERILQHRGYEVFSFNLGGLFGVFFTKGIKEAAELIDSKLQRQFKKYSFERVSIVAHSKGGLVAVWWLLALGGHRYCDRLVTMGTPFKGTPLSWLGLLTPIGLVFKDIWQMRPKSDFLKEMHGLKIPQRTKIYNLYSYRDRIATGKVGCFEPDEQPNAVTYVPMHHITHFEFLYRRDIGDTLAGILGSPYLIDHRRIKKKAKAVLPPEADVPQSQPNDAFGAVDDTDTNLLNTSGNAGSQLPPAEEDSEFSNLKKSS